MKIGRDTVGRSAVALICALGALSAMSAGCSSPGPSQENPVNQRAALMARPSLEEMMARYQQMQNRIRQEVDAAIGPQRWEQVLPPSTAPCGFDFPDETDARAFSVESVGFKANIPDAKWPEVESIVVATVRQYGFTDPAELRIDKPGQHVMGAVDRTLGANFEFGTQKATNMSTSSGCHLPAAKKAAS